MLSDDRRVRLLFYSLWILSLVLQCSLVGLSGDEAYYWRYSRELAWGYFDHPPLTAVLVKAGYLVFSNELGVRLFFIVLLTATIYVLERLVRPRDLKLFYAIVLSIAFLQVGMVWGGGMMAIPDFPLLFFEAVFFIFYREYLERPTWRVYLLLPVVVGLMLLTKYHGILIVGFTVLSNLALLRKASFWIIVGLSTAMMIPHIIWQASNDFPSIRYHLVERSSDPYSFSYMAEYLGSQPFILGPIVGVILIYAGLAFKTTTSFERSLKFTAIGTYVFFFLMSVRGRIEGNWTIITLVPLVVLGYKFIESNARMRNLTMYGFVASISLILIARVIITLHLPLPGRDRFNESLTPWTWTGELKERTGGRPAAFLNSYQKASLYEFYEDVPSFSLNNFSGRKNQYTIWDTEAEFQGQDVAVISNWEIPNLDTIRIMGEYFPYTPIQNFRSTSNLWLRSNLTERVLTTPSSVIETKVRINFSNFNQRDVEANPKLPTVVSYGFFQGRNYRSGGLTSITLTNDMIGTGQLFDATIQTPPEPGTYSLYFAATTGWLPPGINSSPVECVVK